MDARQEELTLLREVAKSICLFGTGHMEVEGEGERVDRVSMNRIVGGDAL